MKKVDIIIALSVFMLALISFGIVFIGSAKGNAVVISQDGKEVYNAPLNKNNVIELENNTVVIEDKSVYIESANCPNQDCVRHKPISEKNQVIACLPNKVIVTIKE